ncbi:hypothetical protein ACTXJY_00375 [Corynebacterium casei]|uniref:hypothetical protein n=1 Tax=Corynebacterium casei TaxID=160386 RepID=UPI003FD07AF6
MSLTTALHLMETQEQNMHYILGFAPLPVQTKKKLKDHIAQSAQIQQEIRNYEKRLNGVVRSKN